MKTCAFLLAIAASLLALGCSAPPSALFGSLETSGSGGSASTTTSSASESAATSGSSSTSASASSQTSSGSTATASSASAGGSTASSSGSGGSGGTCPPAACAQAAPGADVVNCDPACGSVDPRCSLACVGFVPIGEGVTYVRTPPVDQATGDCVQQTGCPTWSLSFELPDGDYQWAADGPEISAAEQDPGMPAPAACGLFVHENCASWAQPPADPNVRYYLFAVVSAQTAGRLYRFEVSSTIAVGPTCAGGCNGSP